MISETYLKLLKSEVKKLDDLTNNAYELEIILQDIVDNLKNAELEFIKLLGNLTSKETLSKIKDKQTSILELLYKYLGARVIDTNYLILKETNHKSFEELANDLKSLIGLENVKKEIKDLVAFNKVQQSREKIGLKKTNRTMHMAFLGNPGTGKTTVARIVGNMYRSLGILSKGHFIEATRTDLIAEYQGQTASKVKRLIQKAKGGVLFIDEAYALIEGSDGIGEQAVATLIKAMEDRKGEFVLILAGYTNEIKKLIQSNPGFESRIKDFMVFQDYNNEELKEIFVNMARDNNFVVDANAIDKLEQRFERERNLSSFGNGRTARNILDECIDKHAFNFKNKEIGIADKFRITEKDVNVYPKVY